LRSRAVKSRETPCGCPFRAQVTQNEDTAAEMEDDFALHISIVAMDILEREIGIILVLPKQLAG
jgi:hypothetical protein